MDKRRKSDELLIANKKLAFQNKEKEKRAAELIIANYARSLIEASLDPLVTISAEGKITDVNEASIKVTGVSRDKLIGTDFSSYFTEPKKALKGYKKVFREGSVTDYPLTIKSKKGKLTDVLYNASVYKDDKGDVIGVFAAARDVTAQKQSSQYARSLIEASLDPLVTISAEGKITDVNEASIKVTGFPREKLIDTDFSNYFTDPQKAQEGYLQVFEKGFVSDYPLTIKHKNRKLTDVLYNASVYKDDKGNVLGVFAAARDVTEQKWAVDLRIANKELAFQNREKEKRADELMMANKELAFQNKEKEKRADELSIANKELIFQNDEKEKRAAELLIANKELAFQNKEKGKRADELIIANKKLAIQNREKEKRADELMMANKELAFQNKEKEKRADEFIIANKELAFQNREKEKRAAELVIADKEIIIQYNEKEIIENANKELEAFSYSVSHDLRAPLRAINGYANILQEDYATKLDADGVNSLNAIMKNSKRMGVLIDDLLAFSRLGRKVVATSEINMTSLVKSVRVEVMIGNSSEVEFRISELLPSMGQQALIKQVWVNLISNAIKFSKHKPKTIIEIGSKYKDNLVVYFVKDNGVGFDMQYYDKLFGIFQRLHSQEEFEGTGIGLAIVQKIVQRHNGKIWAESELNEGTCFYFTLPIINS